MRSGPLGFITARPNYGKPIAAEQLLLDFAIVLIAAEIGTVLLPSPILEFARRRGAATRAVG